MNQQKIFEVLRLKVKASKIITPEGIGKVTKKEIVQCLSDYESLLTEFSDADCSTNTEFKTNILDLCAEMIIMLEQFCNQINRNSDVESLFEKINKMNPINIPRFPNGGFITPPYKVTCGQFDRSASITEIEKQLKEDGNGPKRNRENT